MQINAPEISISAQTHMYGALCASVSIAVVLLEIP